MSKTSALITASIRQALPIRRTVVFVFLELAPTFIYLVATASRTDEAALRGLVEIGVGTFFALVLPVVSIVIAAGALGNERRDMTMSFIALRPISRQAIAGSKLAAAFVAAGALNAIGALVLGVTHTVRYGNAEVVVALLAGALVATAAYASLYLPVGFFTDRAVVGGMAYLLVFENGVAFAVAGLAYLSPWRLGVSVFAGLSESASEYLDQGTASLEMGSALLTAALYVVVSVAFTSLLLKSRDLA